MGAPLRAALSSAPEPPRPYPRPRPHPPPCRRRSPRRRGAPSGPSASSSISPSPTAARWRIDDHSGPWLSATHAASESTLLARSWTEDGRVTHERCEERARLWRTLPDPARAEEVKARSIDAPAGFDTFVSVGVVTGKPDAPVSGFAVAFGGHAHRCFAWIYTTTASGPGAGPLLGERLATMVERSLGKAVIASELLPRIPREAPGGP